MRLKDQYWVDFGNPLPDFSPMSKKKALITGITGQDGSYLAELLLQKGYEIHGLVRQAGAARLPASAAPVHLHDGDLTDSASLARLFAAVQPDEIYNLAAQSNVRVSFDNPENTMDINATGTVRLLEALHKSGLKARFCQAASSEMYGLAREAPQTERTPFYPRSPYAVSKVAAYWATVNYRESYGLHAGNAILFNHESPRRGEGFVTRKITRAVAHIQAGLQKDLSLGTLDSRRDWGFAGEYVEAIWLMLQQETPDDYVIATGETHSVRDFLEAAFNHVGLDWKKYVHYDERYVRPTEGAQLMGDSSKARQKLNWQPKINFQGLVKLMVDADIALLKNQTAAKPAAAT
jgi:GDPmannose 4,6-dehydratase